MSKAQIFRVRLPELDRYVVVKAVVHHDQDYKVDLLAVNGVPTKFADLPRESRRSLLDAILRAVLAAEA